MLEILVAIAAIVAMARIASADGHSALLWGLITFGLCAACLLIPLPLIRVGIAFGLALLAMFAYKIVANR
jgi:hypothetical protein